MSYPATFSVTQPEEFDKAQVALRVLVVIVVSFLQIGNIIFGGAFLVLPVLAAILISQKGPDQYLAESETDASKWLHYLIGFYSYMALATDKLPTTAPEDAVDLQIRTSGSPTVGSALMRIILAIPHALALGLLSIILVVVWIIAAISIVNSGSYPEWAASFIRGYLAWVARLMAYMASLVDEYPPFSFEAGDEGVRLTPAPAAAPGSSD